MVRTRKLLLAVWLFLTKGLIFATGPPPPPPRHFGQFILGSSFSLTIRGFQYSTTSLHYKGSCLLGSFEGMADSRGQFESPSEFGCVPGSVWPRVRWTLPSAARQVCWDRTLEPTSPSTGKRVVPRLGFFLGSALDLRSFRCEGSLGTSGLSELRSLRIVAQGGCAFRVIWGLTWTVAPDSPPPVRFQTGASIAALNRSTRDA